MPLRSFKGQREKEPPVWQSMGLKPSLGPVVLKGLCAKKKKKRHQRFPRLLPRSPPLRAGIRASRVGRGVSSGRCPGVPPAGIPTSTGLSALRQGVDRPLGGFHGCIHEVRINNELQDFKALPPQALGVSPGCKSCSVCRHGLCRAVEKDSVVCECHPGWTGLLCDQEAHDPCLGHRSVSLPLCPAREVGTDGSWRDCSQTVDRGCLEGQGLNTSKQQVLFRGDISVPEPS